jgi:hypothetical protein
VTRGGEDSTTGTVAVCADVGSTFTKVAAIDLGTGALLATAEQPTTVDTDVLRADTAVAELGINRHYGRMLVCRRGLDSRSFTRLVTAEA